MFSVIKNVYGSFVIDGSGLPQDAAIAECAALIDATHGGEVYVVDDATAEVVDGQDCTEARFTAYGIDGQPFQI